ncbi:MAG: redox-sensing transcriptional repressor Rex [Candidatus Brocadiae bacterium]|nr:redox-sensing transcriptional repressor Rex [Candidatus Brocadiia bacterium]
MPSHKSIGRLSLYRSILNRLLRDGVNSLFSHELASLAGATPSQVRRDLMVTGYTGSPVRGYDVRDLLASIGRFLDAPESEGVALVGVGNLGRAIMAFFTGRRPSLTIQAAFDRDPYKVNRVIHGIRCHPMEDLESVLVREHVRVAIITVPAIEAQDIADRLCRAGVKGILNFAPVRLRVLPSVFVEDVDVTMSLEKVAYYSRQGNRAEGI